MAYAVKEIFLTLQGEGAHTGRVAVFCRFAGCNLWSGREADRGSAQCRFCDTDFVGTDGALRVPGVAPNDLTSADWRDAYAGTPWHKHVPARIEAVPADLAAASA